MGIDEEKFQKSDAPETKIYSLGKNQRRILKLFLDIEEAMTQKEITERLNQEYDTSKTPQTVRDALIRMVRREDIPLERKDMGMIYYGISSRHKLLKMFR